MGTVVVGNEGQQYHVGKIALKGQQVAEEASLRDLNKTTNSSIYTPKALKDDLKTITDGYGAGGLVDLDIIPQGTSAGPGPGNGTYIIPAGGRPFLDRVHLPSNTHHTHTGRRRQLPLQPGACLTPWRGAASPNRTSPTR